MTSSQALATSTARLNPALREFWRTPARNRVLHGGRASSKSWDTAGFCIFLACNYKLRFMCLRQFQNKIVESVYTLLKIQAERFGVANQFKFTDNSIIHLRTGSEFIFYGIARNIDEIKSTVMIDVCWIEEAHLLTEAQWRVIEPTMRDEGSQVWIIFNPRFSSDFVYQRFVINPPPDTIVRQINYPDNPFLSDTMRKVIEAMRNEDIEEFNHVYMGQPKSDDDRVIIKRSWIESAIDAHIKLKFEPAGRKVIGFDVADDGADKCANVLAHGSVALWCEEWKGQEDELLKSCSRTYGNARKHEASIRYDCIGVGAAAGAKFDELNSAGSARIKYSKFNAGDAVHEPERYYTQNRMERIKNRDFFSNLKAQTWWLVADRFRNTHDAVRNGTSYPADQLISISSDMPMLEKLKTELSTPRRDFDANGRVKVESKKDLAKRDVPSPNCFVAGTFIETPTGQVKIETLKVGDSVITPMGVSKIIHVHVNESDNIVTNFGLTGTADHKIFTWNRGWAHLLTASSCDKIEPFKYGKMKWQILNLFYTKAKCSQFSERVDTIVLDGTEGKMLEPSDFYTGGFGLITMARFLMIITSIMLMVIGAITGLKTWCASLVKSIKALTCKKDSNQNNTENKTEKTSMQPEKKQKNGINQKREENGIQSIREINFQKEHTLNTNALYATNCFYLEKHTRQKLVQENAQQKQQMIEQKFNVNLSASAAGNLLFIQKSEKEKFEDVLENAHCKSRKVYNITLDKHNVYYANGILVKNCADAFVMCFAPEPFTMVKVSSGALAMAMGRS